MAKKSKKAKKVVVNRKFLTDLANMIYDSKSRKFLHLCDGTLQNGPDPTDEERPMHCGLGELYFEMTGHQPKEDSVGEEDVVNKAVELSTLSDMQETAGEIEAAIKKLKLPEGIQEKLIEAVSEADEDDLRTEAEKNFREALDDIPSSNDDGCKDACDTATFRKRSQRVAAQFRAAAKFLPA